MGLFTEDIGSAVLPGHPLDQERAARVPAGGGVAEPEPLDGVVPFSIDAAEARRRVQRWVRWSLLAGPGFRSASLSEPVAIHLPCFTFSAHTESTYEGTTQVSRQTGSGKSRRTVTRTEHRDGRVVETFHDLPVCAVPTLDAPNLRRAEPWPTHTLAPPDSGSHDADATPPSQLSLRAAADLGRARIEEEIRCAVREEMGGKNQQIRALNSTLTGQTYRHVLLPVVVVPVTYRLTTQYVLVNGATGKVGGRRPGNRRRRTAAVLGAICLGMALFAGLVWPEECNPRCADDQVTPPASGPALPLAPSQSGGGAQSDIGELTGREPNTPGGAGDAALRAELTRR